MTLMELWKRAVVKSAQQKRLVSLMLTPLCDGMH